MKDTFRLADTRTSRTIRIVLLFASINCSALAQKGLYPDVAHPAVLSTYRAGLEVFVRGMNSHLVQRTWNGSQWSGWKNLGGDLTAAPSVTSSRPGRLDVFVRGLNGHLVHRIHENGNWSGWKNLGGDLTSAPAAVSPAPGRIDVFVRGLNGKLVQRTFSNGTWGGWNNLGGHLTSAPAAVVTARNRIEVFVRGMNFHLVQRSFDGVSWSGWNNLGGDLTAAPAAAASSPNNLHIFVRGMSGHLVHRSFRNGAWSGWNNLGGDLTSAPAATAVDGDNLEVFVRGRNDDLVQRSFIGGTWSGWKNLGGDLRGKRRARLRLLTQNVFGLRYPGSWTGGPDWAVCNARNQEFGRRVAAANPPYDIVAVQEYIDGPDPQWYTCDPSFLKDAIQSTGRYRNSNNTRLFYPDIPWYARPSDGGIGILTLHPIKKFGEWEWDNDRAGWFQAIEGFIFARIEVPFTDIELDVYVTHLNCNCGTDNRQRRKKQLQQFADKIKELSRNSGNPVILMGDFNIGGPPSGAGAESHADILSILKHPQDLWMDTHPDNNGATADCANNNVKAFTSPGCTTEHRIDYIFVLTDPAFTNSPYIVKLYKKHDVKIVGWRIENFTTPFPPGQSISEPNVSDHFGVEAFIDIRDK